MLKIQWPDVLACASGIFTGTVAFSRTHFDPIFRATTLTPLTQ